MSKEIKKFSYLDSKNVEHVIDVDSKDLTLVQENIRITDKAMKTKPTTFFKDALKRFAKNKSSIVGAVVLGIIVLGAVFIPVIDQNSIDSSDPNLIQQVDLYPRLFSPGSGFWDGTYIRENQTIVLDWDKYLEDGTVIATPTNPADIKNIIGGSEGFFDVKISASDFNGSTYGHGGYVRFYCTSRKTGASYRTPKNYQFPFDFSGETDYNIHFVTESYNSVGDGTQWLATYGVEKAYGLDFMWTETVDGAKVDHAVNLLPATTTERKAWDINLSDFKSQIATERAGQSLVFDSSLDPRLAISLEKGDETTDMEFQTYPVIYNNLLIKEFTITTSDTTSKVNVPIVGKNGVFEEITHQEFLEKLSFNDANEALVRPSRTIEGGETWNPYYWFTDGNYSNRTGYQINIATASCRWDTYEDKLGLKYYADFGFNRLSDWKDRGWIAGNIDLLASSNTSGKSLEELNLIREQFLNSFEILDKVHCPLLLETEADKAAFNVTPKDAGKSQACLWVGGNVTNWRYLFPDRESMPIYIFGTDDKGRDMLKYVASGLRTSLILGVITSAITFAFGLVWGSIAGYYGGWTDILMERFTDILGGIPWIVLMTLIIVIYGSNFLTFGIALCLTGWIGTASLTRTQFYRFKSREYILAARTLGASDMRLIFRHILPNAVGTIITSSVLMVPSVIFSEATISYILPGTLTLDAFGRILSENQTNYTQNSYLLWFPSVVMALMMISFNLFGNGLRDAFNPSLKGED